MKEQTSVEQHYNPPKRSESFHLGDWQREFVAAVFSLMCVVVIIIILKVYQERSLSSWHFVHNITLNTVVALLSTISRTALEVIMGIAFLVATRVHTWRRGVVFWKSSAIVPLLTHMEGWRTEESRMGSA
jgi:hypothetical protein